MGKKNSRTRLAMRIILAAIAAAGIVAWLLMPKKEEQQHYVPNVGDGTIVPTMATTDVSTFISDSGYTKYHITADVWQMFEDAEEPFWRFPVGLYLEQYDRDLNPAAHVVCDSAIYFSRKRLWRLDGNVVMVNTERDSFLTEQLFWDQNSRKVYSDSFIHIVRTERIIEGYGFESDQNMLYYTVNRPTAILPTEGMTSEQGRRTDTVADTATAARSPRVRASASARHSAEAAPTPASPQEATAAPLEVKAAPRKPVPPKKL